MPDTPYLQHAKLCPVCNQKLSLYALISNIGTFKCTNNFVLNKKNKLNFYPLKDSTFGLHVGVMKTDNFVIKLMADNSFQLTFNSEHLFRLIESSSLSFFYLCNPLAITPSDYSVEINTYGLDAFSVCYYNVSELFSFTRKDNVPTLIQSDVLHSSKLEVFSTSLDEKRYSLHNSYSENKSILYFNDTVDKNNIKKTFIKEFDLLDHQLDFSNKSKILNKFDSWILLS